MPGIIIKIKNKKQEKVVKAFLENQDIDYSSIAEEDAAVYTTKKKEKRPKKTSKAKERLIAEIKEAVKQINLIKEGKLKARPIQELLDEL
jgi:hypothetical protein